MKYLLKYFYLIWAASLTAGVYYGEKFILSVKFNWMLLVSIVLFSLISLLFIHKKIQIFKKNAAAIIIAAFIFALLGFLSSNLNFGGEIRNIFRDFNNKYISVEGRISNYPAAGKGVFYFNLETYRIIFNQKNDEPGNYIKSRDVVKVRMKMPRSNLPERDDFIKFTGKVIIEDNMTLLVSDGFDFNKITSDSPFLWKIYGLRKGITKCLKNLYIKNLKFDYAAISEALILGNTQNIRDYILKNFKNSGVYHLLAISGLHISFFIYIFVILFKKVTRVNIGGRTTYLGKIMPILLIFIFLFIYNFIIGQRASALRATIMALFVNLAHTINKEYDRRIIISFTYIIMLLFVPAFSGDAGFWLSFASMAGITFVNRIITNFLKKVYIKFRKNKKNRLRILDNFVAKTVIITISINLFILPLMLFYFGSFSAVSVFANILVIPAFYLLLFILILSSLSGLFWPPAGGFLIKSSSFLFFYIIKITGILGSNKFSVIDVSNFSKIYMLIYYFILFIILLLMSRDYCKKEYK